MPGILKGARQEFKKTIAGSFILHVLVIAVALMLFNNEKRTFFNPVYTVDLVAPGPVRQAVAVQKPAVEKPVEKPVAAPKPPEAAVKKESVKTKKAAEPREKAVNLKPKTASLDEAIKKIAENVKKKQDSSMVDSTIEGLKRKREAESKQVASRLEELKKELSRPKPQAHTQGASAVAEGARGAASIEARYPAYFSVIHDRVQEEWSVYEDLKDSKLSLIVSVKIDRSGKLLETHIEKSSGDSHFDESLIKAIKKTEFPRLPEDFEGNFLETGFRFCPSCER